LFNTTQQEGTYKAHEIKSSRYIFGVEEKKKKRKGISNINLNAVNQKSRRSNLLLEDRIYLESNLSQNY
jgi:hypothetical protein